MRGIGDVDIDDGYDHEADACYGFEDDIVII